MVIFTCSAKHTAVSLSQVREGQCWGWQNRGTNSLASLCPPGFQFDSCVWMPNLPPTMQLPPPTTKGQARPEGFIATLPPVNATCDVIIALWLLSKEPGDRVSVKPSGDRRDCIFLPSWPIPDLAIRSLPPLNLPVGHMTLGHLTMR
jgi:hypothetical protein